MDEAGVAKAVLTDQVQVMGADVARMLNDGIAQVQRRYPDRFLGAIHLPVHEPAAAERELERGIEELGLRAVALLACHLDVHLDNPVMNPLYERIQKENLPIVIHPQSKPTGSETSYKLDRRVAAGVRRRAPDRRARPRHVRHRLSARMQNRGEYSRNLERGARGGALGGRPRRDIGRHGEGAVRIVLKSPWLSS